MKLNKKINKYKQNKIKNTPGKQLLKSKATRLKTWKERNESKSLENESNGKDWNTKDNINWKRTALKMEKQ